MPVHERNIETDSQRQAAHAAAFSLEQHAISREIASLPTLEIPVVPQAPTPFRSRQLAALCIERSQLLETGGGDGQRA